MSWRIHTADAADPVIVITTVAAVDKEFGYEHVEEDSSNKVLLFLDSWNQEAWVFVGTEEARANLLKRLSAEIPTVTSL